MNKFLNWVVSLCCRHMRVMYSTTFYDVCNVMGKANSNAPKYYAHAWQMDNELE